MLIMDPLLDRDACSPSASDAHRLASEFATTHWSLVVSAGSVDEPAARRALADLCQVYWYPIYAYVRRRVGARHEAQDLTQEFFSYLLEKHTIAQADRSRGRFRSFLLTACKNFLSNQREKARAEKRGGAKAVLSLDFASGESRYQFEPSENLTAEKLFERRWVLALLEEVLERLRVEQVEAGRGIHFEQLKTAITGEATAAEYANAGRALGISATAAKQAGHRLRKRYRQLFRAEVLRSLADESELDDEIGTILEVMGD